MVWYVMLCYGMVWYVMLCYVLLCYVMLCMYVYTHTHTHTYIYIYISTFASLKLNIPEHSDTGFRCIFAKFIGIQTCKALQSFVLTCFKGVLGRIQGMLDWAGVAWYFGEVIQRYLLQALSLQYP